jgi:hypothetical protein
MNPITAAASARPLCAAAFSVQQAPLRGAPRLLRLVGRRPAGPPPNHRRDASMQVLFHLTAVGDCSIQVVIHSIVGDDGRDTFIYQ